MHVKWPTYAKPSVQGSSHAVTLCDFEIGACPQDTDFRMSGSCHDMLILLEQDPEHCHNKCTHLQCLHRACHTLLRRCAVYVHMW